MVCCGCNGNRGLCKGCACVKAGRACFYCLPGRDGHCLNPLGSFGEAAVSSEPVTSLTAHSLMDQSPQWTPNQTTSVSPRIDSASPLSIASPPSVEESVCVETHALRSPSRIASPFCGLSTCGSHTVPDLADFLPMAKLVLL